MAVHARQLAFKPNLQIIRRSRRPLLCGVEQARQSALANHVHRIAPMGPSVLINGTRYYLRARLPAVAAVATGQERAPPQQCSGTSKYLLLSGAHELLETPGE